MRLQCLCGNFRRGDRIQISSRWRQRPNLIEFIEQPDLW
jgi:hypothetical protein